MFSQFSHKDLVGWLILIQWITRLFVHFALKGTKKSSLRKWIPHIHFILFWLCTFFPILQTKIVISNDNLAFGYRACSDCTQEEIGVYLWCQTRWQLPTIQCVRLKPDPSHPMTFSHHTHPKVGCTAVQVELGAFSSKPGGGDKSYKWQTNDVPAVILSYLSVSDCDLCASFRPGQSEAGLLLHRHLLSQQHLRVCVLLLPTRVTAPQLTSPPSNERSGKTKLSFLAHAHTKKKRKKERMHHKNKNKLWLVPFTNSAASIPVK